MSVKKKIQLKPQIQLKKPVSNLFKDCYPILYQQIHPTKNTSVSIDLLTYGSHKTIWWICPKANCDHHIWAAAVKSRTINGSGCPYCDKKKNVQM